MVLVVEAVEIRKSFNGSLFDGEIPDWWYLTLWMKVGAQELMDKIVVDQDLHLVNGLDFWVQLQVGSWTNSTSGMNRHQVFGYVEKRQMDRIPLNQFATAIIHLYHNK